MASQIAKGAAATTINFTQGTPAGTTATPQITFSLWRGNTQVVPNTLMAAAGSSYTGTSTDGSGLTVTVNGSGQPQYTVGTASLAANSSLANGTGLFLLINSPNNSPSYATVDIVAAAPAPPRNLTTVVVY